MGVEAYKVPMVNMQKVKMQPPTIILLRREILSARRRAGMEMASMRIAERPEARKEEVFAGMPAWAKRVGA
jgi:hypothetical protein